MSLAALFDDAAPDEPWFVEPRDRLRISEEQRQQEFLRLLPYVAPGIEVWAVPNAGRRTRWEIAKAKREGLRAGALDLTVTWNHGCAFAEIKDGSGQPTPNQRDMLNRLYRQGHRCGVFRTADGLYRWLAEQGAPVNLRALEAVR